MRIDSPAAEEAALLAAAQTMAAAARTAPKGRGRDLLQTCILTGAEKDALADVMAEIGGAEQTPFARDAAGVRRAQAILLIATEHAVMGLRRCGFCGFGDCAGCAAARGMCVFVPGDLGIAIGSAVSVAADRRIDNRVMYTAGYAALKMQLFGKNAILAFGIPLSVSGKSPFFDR